MKVFELIEELRRIPNQHADVGEVVVENAFLGKEQVTLLLPELVDEMEKLESALNDAEEENFRLNEKLDNLQEEGKEV